MNVENDINESEANEILSMPEQNEIDKLMRQLHAEFLKIDRCQKKGIRCKDKTHQIQNKLMKLTKKSV